MDNNEKIKLFKKELDSISEDKLKEFAKLLLVNTEDWFYHDPASTSGLYHPSYANGNGGLMRHTRALVYFLNEFQRTEMYSFSEHQWNLLKISAIAHDIRKHLPGNIYSAKHAEDACKFVKEMQETTLFVSEEDCNYMCEAISSHMGIWGHKKIGSPMPVLPHQIMLAQADICASRKEVELKIFSPEDFYGEVKEETIEDRINKYRLTFGRDRGVYGLTIKEVDEKDPNFLVWAKNKEDLKDQEGRMLINEYFKRKNC